MTSSQIAFLVCGLVFVLSTILCCWWFIYRIKHLYNEIDIQKCNWFTKWIKSNIKIVILMITVLCLIIARTFIIMCIKPSDVDTIVNLICER